MEEWQKWAPQVKIDEVLGQMLAHAGLFGRLGYAKLNGIVKFYELVVSAERSAIDSFLHS